MTFKEWLVLHNDQSDFPLENFEEILKASHKNISLDYISLYQKKKLATLSAKEWAYFLNKHKDYARFKRAQEKSLVKIDEHYAGNQELKKRVENAKKTDIINDLDIIFRPFKKNLIELEAIKELKELSEDIWKAALENKEHPKELKEKLAALIDWQSPLKDLGLATESLSRLLAEKIYRSINFREIMRNELWQNASLICLPGPRSFHKNKKNNLVDQKHSLAFLTKAQNSYRYLALKRASKNKEIIIRIDFNPKAIWQKFDEAMNVRSIDITNNAFLFEIIRKARNTAINQLLYSDFEIEIQQKLTEAAQQDSLDIFATNLKKILYSPAFGQKNVLAFQAHEEKIYLVAVDSAGAIIEKAEAPFKNQEVDAATSAVILALIQKNKPESLAYCSSKENRQIEASLKKLFKEAKITLAINAICNSGPVVYSQNETLKKENASLTNWHQIALSTARQLQDPLHELLQIETRLLGLGQYQQEIDPSALGQRLSLVQRESVHQIGIDLNIATKESLQKLNGIDTKAAEAICAERERLRFFSDREQILKIEDLSAEAKEYGLPFMRLPESLNPLDQSRVHPKHYSHLKAACKKLKLSYPQDLQNSENISKLKSDDDLKKEIGEEDFEVLFEHLNMNFKDPRGEFKSFQFREDIQSLKDLKQGMFCSGRISNITHFGLFIDIGAGSDGLVHLSEISYGRGDKEILKYNLGQNVQVKVLSVDFSKKQLSLSMKTEAQRQKFEEEKKLSPRPKRSFNKKAPFKKKPNFDRNKESSRHSERKRSQRAPRERFAGGQFAELAKLKEQLGK